MASYVLTWERLSSRAVFLHSIPYVLCHDMYKNNYMDKKKNDSQFYNIL